MEKNLRIVPRERMGEEMVHDGDSLEIIRLVGGG
ncbi:MAG: MoaD/ThiS family protein [Syntrophales bacterium]